MKTVLTLVLVFAILAAMPAAAFASYTCQHGAGPQRVEKDVDVNVGVDSAICLATESKLPGGGDKNFLDLGNMNPCDRSYSWDVVRIWVMSNRAYQKTIDPGDLTCTNPSHSPKHVIDQDRLSLEVDDWNIKVGEAGWTFDGQKYWSPIHGSGTSRESLQVDLQIGWNDHADTYRGTLEVAAQQL